MSVGKYSPHHKGPFVHAEWKTGTEGRTSVDADGFDWYGYDENGKDAAGLTEADYFNQHLGELMNEHEAHYGPDFD